MAEKAAQLQNYNQELVKYIETLKRRKAKIQMEMDKDNNEKHGIAHEIGVLEMKQSELDHRISRRTIKYNKLTEVLNQSELGYSKVVDSLQVLLNFASKESKTIDEPEPPNPVNDFY